MEHATGAFRFWPDRPGFLLTAFDWAAPAILELARLEPELIPRLLALDKARLHLFALAVAFAEDWPRPKLARLLARGSDRAIIERTAGRRPPGVKRVLGCLGCGVMDRERYGDLLDLLEDPATSAALHHRRDFISEREIRGMKMLPPALRSQAVMDAFGEHKELAHLLPEGLKHLVARGAAAEYDALAARLGHLGKHREISGEVQRLVDSLPLELSLPPEAIGAARRIDAPAEIRRLAIEWRNCLRMYLDQVGDATCCIYLWHDEGGDVLCSVKRRGRLGWFLHDIEGRDHARPKTGVRGRIVDAFKAAGFPRADVAEAIDAVIAGADDDSDEVTGDAPPRLRRHR